jgi:hypothetical protein
VKSSFHVRTLALALLVWAVFFLIGLPAYYQQYSVTAMAVFCAVLVPGIWIAARRVLSRVSAHERLSRAMWLAFYFTAPLALLDFAYCGVYLGYGVAFAARYWYLTLYYFLPWPLLAAVARQLTTPQSGHRTSAST